MRRLTIFLMLMVLFSSSVSAFSLSSSETSKKICIGTTALFSTTLEGSGKFTVSQGGSASGFSMTVPNEFESYGSQTVYTYVTPTGRTPEGSYDLSIDANDGTGKKAQIYNLEVRNCPKTQFFIEGKKATCPCQETRFIIHVGNNAEYAETYSLSAQGTLKEWTSLSESFMTLQPGEEKEVESVVKAPCNIHGQYNIIFNLKPSHYFSSISSNSILEIQPCYEYSLELPPEVGLCENDSLAIPLNVLNQGTANNSYKIEIEGPKWISYDKSLTLNSDEGGKVNVILNPPMNAYGNFTISARAVSGYGSVQRRADMKAVIQKCYGLSVKFSDKKATICDSEDEYSYPLTIGNLGKFERNVLLSSESWISVPSSIIIKAGENKTINVRAKIPKNLSFGEHSIVVNAEDGLSKSSDSLRIKYLPINECFSPQIELSEDHLRIGKEEQKTIEAEIMNSGIENATFSLELSGNGSSFSMLNPKNISIGSKKSEKVFIYLSPQSFVDNGKYFLTISASKGSLNYSREIRIDVSDQNKTAESDYFSGKMDDLLEFLKGVGNGFKRAMSSYTTYSPQNDSMVINGSTEFLMSSGSKGTDGSNEITEFSEQDLNNSDLNITEFSWDNVKSSFMNFKSYKEYIVGAVSVILLIILISSGFWKRIINFFEDD